MNIKICGLKRPADILAVNAALPDFIGFVFAKSHRQVTVDEASALKEKLDTRIRAAGVFVNAEKADIVLLCRDGVIDLVQLHGDEDEAYIAELKKDIDCPVIKAVRVQSPGQILAAEKLPCDYLLLDTYRKDAYGGTGERFNYALIPPLNKPFFLAGGLDAGNLKAAAAITPEPFCLDVSGGAETDGIKDAGKIREIVRIVKNI